MLSMFFIGCDKEDIAVKGEFHEALSSKYPAATNIRWEKDGKYYVADCYVSGIETEVKFDKNAQWIKSEFNLSYDMLPETIKTSLTQMGYNRINIDDIDLIYEPNKEEFYEIEIERIENDYTIYMNKEGTLLSSRP